MDKLISREELHKRLIEVAAQSPAKKRKVGAVIAEVYEDKYRIVSEGYNYNPSGGPCETEDNITHDNVIHAEVAALSNITILLSNIPNNWKMFTTHSPCAGCLSSLRTYNMEYEVIGDFLKFDNNKPRVALVPTSLIEGVAKVLSYGARKYKTNNWRKADNTERYISALYRHLMAWQNGEEYDPESKLHHLEHVACNVAFLIEMKDKPKIQE